MIELTIPGRGLVQLDHLVCDVNGTLAVDGSLLDGLDRPLSSLRHQLQLHLITADTHGRQDEIDRRLDLQAVRLKPGDEALQKAEYIRGLGAGKVVAIGQGANDALMLREAALGICVLSPEGTALSALLACDLVALDIFTALEILQHPKRIAASLRQ